MTELYYKMKIIFLLEKYWQWLYQSNNINKKYFKSRSNKKVEVNIKELTNITNNKKVYKKIKRELDNLIYN